MLVPVTVIQAGPCVVLQKKDVENDGYEAIQIGFDDKKASRMQLNQRLAMRKKQGQRLSATLEKFAALQLADYEVGQELKADLFAEGEFVDVTGTSKGKGFQGNIKRHNQSTRTDGSRIALSPWTRFHGFHSSEPRS